MVHWPVDTFHTFVVSSLLPVATYSPSALNATLATKSLCACGRWTGVKLGLSSHGEGTTVKLPLLTMYVAWPKYYQGVHTLRRVLKGVPIPFPTHWGFPGAKTLNWATLCKQGSSCQVMSAQL